MLCLLNQAKSICSSQHLFEVGIGKLKRLLYDNNHQTCFLMTSVVNLNPNVMIFLLMEVAYKIMYGVKSYFCAVCL